MATACILQQNACVHLKSRHLEVSRANPETGKQEVLRSIPLHDLDRLIISEDAQMTSRALARMLREDIPISVLGWNDRFLGGFLPATPAQGSFRLNQYRRTLDSEFTLEVARQWVTAKIYNQRRVLQRLDAARRQHRDKNSDEMENVTARETADDLGGYLKTVEAVRSIDEVRGLEGASTARYFRAWSTFLPEGAIFGRRSTRPPLNAVNACISFASTLLYHEAVTFLHSHGLDPSLGALHTTENRRWSLALDLIEPFRPAVGESLTLDLFSRSILNPKEHFEHREGGVYLNDAGRKKFLLQYERRLERQFLSEHVGHRTTLRQQIENEAVQYKGALDTPETLKPFRMN
ncbi:MAG: CRISPR-associated endonuclease Cas1 [Verrucomicrobia subdivision 3 bacterium]|nr:CRISPR-associated endonuclease Cas1 [Limisphaerales bacterium]MCS1416475.1 CRISPR-associated endonuclease Cas1 [Limisphaerales bacterium]